MPSIGINISDKLINILLNIQTRLEQQEQLTIELDDIIEEAVLEYYNISLLDLQEHSINTKIEHSINLKINIEKERIHNVLHILNTYRFKRDAAKKLNISERTLYRYIKEFNIQKNSNNEYSIIV